MPVVVLIAMHENMAGAKGHYFKRASQEMEYRQIGGMPLTDATVAEKRRGKVQEFQRKLYRKAKQDRTSANA